MCASAGVSLNSAKPSLVITNTTVYTPFQVIPKGEIVIKDKKIVSVGKASGRWEKEAGVINAENRIVIPGLIDTHICGIGGYDFRHGAGALVNIAKILPKFGVTGFLDTLYAVPRDQVTSQIDEAYKAVQKGWKGSQFLGFHLEGPFFNPKFSGLARKENLALPDPELVKKVVQESRHFLKIVTLSPELDGAVDLIRLLRNKDVVAAVGHSEATRDQIKKAVEAGLSHVTHIFNAMSERNVREPGRTKPGLSDIVLLDDHLTASVIADGVHVSKILLELLVKVKGVAKVVLITDSFMGTDMPGGRYTFPDGSEVYVDGKVHRLIKDDTIAGSLLTLNGAVRNMAEMTEVALNKAVQMGSYNPARLLGIERQKGSIAVGKDADLVIVDKELNVFLTVINGEVLYSKDL